MKKTFLGQERSAAVGGIHASRDHNNVRSVLRNTKQTKLHRTIQNKMHGIVTSGVVFRHDIAHQQTAPRTQAMLEHFNWELFKHPPQEQVSL
jgi:hypothetical protein